jgi:hypothetical protein
VQVGLWIVINAGAQAHAGTCSGPRPVVVQRTHNHAGHMLTVRDACAFAAGLPTTTIDARTSRRALACALTSLYASELSSYVTADN